MDNLDKIIEELRVKMIEYTKNDNSGHNIDHLERTLKYAQYLQEHEGGDIVVISISAFIHDIHRILQSKVGHFVSPKESLPTVNEFIKDLPITETQKEQILFAIEHHEEYNFGKDGNNATNIESQILQDADNLDAIGAIGLIRALRYGILYGEPMYNPNVDFYRTEYEESSDDASTLHHINNKLLRLGEHMNTKTARELAVDKTKFLQDFLNRYVDEFHSKIE